jgi:hypothetical protein
VEVDATGVSGDTQQLFWTSLYRTYIAPINVTGDNPLWNSSEPYWDSFYCIWYAPFYFIFYSCSDLIHSILAFSGIPSALYILYTLSPLPSHKLK